LKNFLLILLLIPFTIVGQINKDSLFNCWQNEQLQDTVRLDALHVLIWKEYLFSQPDSASFYAELLYEMAKSKGLKLQMTNAL